MALSFIRACCQNQISDALAIFEEHGNDITYTEWYYGFDQMRVRGNMADVIKMYAQYRSYNKNINMSMPDIELYIFDRVCDNLVLLEQFFELICKQDPPSKILGHIYWLFIFAIDAGNVEIADLIIKKVCAYLPWSSKVRADIIAYICADEYKLFQNACKTGRYGIAKWIHSMYPMSLRYLDKSHVADAIKNCPDKEMVQWIHEITNTPATTGTEQSY